MKIIKKLIVCLLVLFLAFTTFLGILSKTISPEIVRKYVNTELTALTSQPAQINGDISWQLLPLPGIRLSGIEIGNTNNSKNYSVAIEKLLFNLKIAPLLRGKLVFSEIKANGFKIEINSDLPWSSIPPLKPEEEPKPAGIRQRFDIERLILSRGQFVFIENGKTVNLSGIQLSAENINLNQDSVQLHLKTRLHYLNPGQHQAHGSLLFKGCASLSKGVLDNPKSFLHLTSLDGQLTVRDLIIDKVRINKAKAVTSFKHGILQLNPVTIGFYQGEAIGDLRYEPTDKNLQLNFAASNLNSGLLTSDLFDSALLKGKLDFSLHTQSVLHKGSWLNRTAGNGKISIRDGALSTVNLHSIMQNASNTLGQITGLTKPEQRNISQALLNVSAANQGETPFEIASMQYQLNNNVLRSDNLFLKTAILKLKGNGQLRLDSYNLSGAILAYVIAPDANMNQIQQLLGGYFPLTVSGTLTQPVILPDLKKINPTLTQMWLKERLTKPVIKLKEQLKALF
ncbi:AsmA family protein [Legionella dresdenensis]|uniref:AsmA family protein n=1 Tax=Legionella dresdenensis TaxID=450200 RepID=A0ABV8CBV2_9GAMM